MTINTITNNEKLLLRTIILLMQQYMRSDSEFEFDHEFMSAGEWASTTLQHFNLAEDDGRIIILDPVKYSRLESDCVNIGYYSK